MTAVTMRVNSYRWPGNRPSPTWEVSARLSLLSGRPFTPYDEAVSTAHGEQHGIVPIPGLDWRF